MNRFRTLQAAHTPASPIRDQAWPVAGGQADGLMRPSPSQDHSLVRGQGRVQGARHHNTQLMHRGAENVQSTKSTDSSETPDLDP
ncbi:unnamed protein product [Gadus morhua 'NCC']